MFTKVRFFLFMSAILIQYLLLFFDGNILEHDGATLMFYKSRYCTGPILVMHEKFLTWLQQKDPDIRFPF